MITRSEKMRINLSFLRYKSLNNLKCSIRSIKVRLPMKDIYRNYRDNKTNWDKETKLTFWKKMKKNNQNKLKLNQKLPISKSHKRPSMNTYKLIRQKPSDTHVLKTKGRLILASEERFQPKILKTQSYLISKPKRKFWSICWRKNRKSFSHWLRMWMNLQDSWKRSSTNKSLHIDAGG